MKTCAAPRQLHCRGLPYICRCRGRRISAAPPFPQRHPRVRIDRDDMEVWRDGETKAEYLAAHQRCVRRLRRILARKREMEKWCEKWDAMHERYVKEVDALQAIKPEGVH